MPVDLTTKKSRVGYRHPSAIGACCCECGQVVKRGESVVHIDDEVAHMACLREQEIEPGGYTVTETMIPGLQFSSPSELD